MSLLRLIQPKELRRPPKNEIGCICLYILTLPPQEDILAVIKNFGDFDVDRAIEWSANYLIKLLGSSQAAVCLIASELCHIAQLKYEITPEIRLYLKNIVLEKIGEPVEAVEEFGEVDKELGEVVKELSQVDRDEPVTTTDCMNNIEPTLDSSTISCQPNL